MSFENDILRLLLLENYIPSAKSDSNSESKVESEVKSLDSSVRFGDRTYAARKFGNKIWMIDNLDYSVRHIGVIPDDGTRTQLEMNYYSWRNAMSIASYFPGWHLPSVEEWEELNKYRVRVGLDSFKLRFNLFSTGYIMSNGELRGADQFACFWTSAGIKDSTGGDLANGVFFDLNDYDDTFGICKYTTRSTGRCIRLVKDS